MLIEFLGGNQLMMFLRMLNVADLSSTVVSSVLILFIAAQLKVKKERHPWVIFAVFIAIFLFFSCGVGDAMNF